MQQAEQPLGDIPSGLRQQGFRKFEHGAVDIVLAAAFNATGTRLTLASADHRIRVYAIDTNGMWTVLDQWRGHDAEILDASSLCL